MNRQLAFNDVARHLLTQACKSLRGTCNCAYRGNNGLKCAIGVLIPDEKYSKSLENIVARDSYVMKAIDEKYEVTPGDFDDADFLASLQHIHDYFLVSDWKSELRELALFEGVSAQCLEEFRDE